MINIAEQYALARWIKYKRNTDGENPKLYECAQWYKNVYKVKKLSVSDKNSIAHILAYN
tara:strand:- start:349 stop:525 length:177 start_codon:yes stop_codon:yes gene_type:complete